MCTRPTYRRKPAQSSGRSNSELALCGATGSRVVCGLMINAVSDLDPRRREELHRVAREIFADQGFEPTTLRDIGNRMGLTAGSLYHYIDSKQALLASVMADLEPPPVRPWRAAVEDPAAAAEWLSDVMRAHVEIITADRAGMTLAMSELNALPDPLRAILRDRMRQ